MLKIEYLIFIDTDGIKCKDEKSFNHLLQSNPEIEVKGKKIRYKSMNVDYDLSFGKIADTDRTYFHLTFHFEDLAKVDLYIDFLKAIKSVLHIVTKSPQTLYDGISIYYSDLAYPIISDIENVMRKLITKFMLTKVGIDWSKDRTPDDVKTSINSNNKDLTFLHNVDFIQLKNFLFSENYPTHKENLVKKLKEAKNINDLNLEDIKILIPNSNWERYFSTDLSISKEKLIKNWDELYDLRCKVAHNKTFSKSDYERVVSLCEEIKPLLENAIQSLAKIEIDKSTREILEEEALLNFNALFGSFILNWNIIEKNIFELSSLLIKDNESKRKRIFLRDLTKLAALGYIDEQIYSRLRRLTQVRNEIVHNSVNWSEYEILRYIDELLYIISILDDQINSLVNKA